MPIKKETEQIQTQTDVKDATEETVNIPEKDLFTWKAPSRVFITKGKDFWMKIIIISSLFAFILFVIEGVMPVILLISVLFLFYVLSNVKPEEIEYKLTNKGVKIADKRNDWEIILRFWFTKKVNTDILVLDLKIIPWRLELVFDQKDKEKIKETLSKYIPEEEAPKNKFDKTAEWISSKL